MLERRLLLFLALLCCGLWDRSHGDDCSGRRFACHAKAFDLSLGNEHSDANDLSRVDNR